MDFLSYIIPIVTSGVIAFIIYYTKTIRYISFQLGKILSKIETIDKLTESANKKIETMDKLTGSTNERIGRLEGKFDEFISRTETTNKRIDRLEDKRIDRLEDRIDKIIMGFGIKEGKHPLGLEPYIEKFNEYIKMLTPKYITKRYEEQIERLISSPPVMGIRNRTERGAGTFHDTTFESIQVEEPLLLLEEIDRIKTYRDKIISGKPFNIEEYRDFKFISKKVKKKLPTERQEEFEWTINGLLGVAGGSIIGALSD